MGWLARSRQALRTLGSRMRAAATLLASGELYHGAGSGYRFRGWLAPGTGPTAAIMLSGDALRNRSRAEARNNGWARNILGLLVANLWGTGFTPHPLFGAQDEGAAAEASAEWCRQTSRRWRLWTKRADADGGNFEGLGAKAVRGMVEGGEAFIVRVDGESAGIGLQLRVLEAEMVPLWDHRLLDNGHVVRAGIERDASGQIVAYWMEPEHPGEFTLRQRDGARLVRVDARRVLHLFHCLRPGQARGEPWLAPALLRLHDFGGYLDAEVVRKKAAANYVFKLEAPDPNHVSEAIGKYHDEAAQNGEIDTKPMSTVVTAVGESFDIVAPADVGPNFDPFCITALREICAGVGVPYGLGTGDMSQEVYTSHRAARTTFEARMDAIQYATIVPLLNALWVWWLEQAIVDGVIRAPRFVQWREDYLDVEWIPPKREWIDPQKEVAGVTDEYDLGITSLTRICAARGESYAEILRERIAERVLREQLERAAGLAAEPPPSRTVRPAMPAEERPVAPTRTGTNG